MNKQGGCLSKSRQNLGHPPQQTTIAEIIDCDLSSQLLYRRFLEWIPLGSLQAFQTGDFAGMGMHIEYQNTQKPAEGLLAKAYRRKVKRAVQIFI